MYAFSCAARRYARVTLSLSLSLFFSPSLSLPQREFEVEPYMHRQKDIGHAMRTILVDWLIEVQENFELFHETLYLGVKLVDIYLSRKEVLREYLQLVGATCLLIASKFEVTLKFVQDFAHEILCCLAIYYGGLSLNFRVGVYFLQELSPPLVDDFLYLCDDAYKRDQILSMEREVLLVLDYDINIPIAYRFLRRLARVNSPLVSLLLFLVPFSFLLSSLSLSSMSPHRLRRLQWRHIQWPGTSQSTLFRNISLLT